MSGFEDESPERMLCRLVSGRKNNQVGYEVLFGECGARVNGLSDPELVVLLSEQADIFCGGLSGQNKQIFSGCIFTGDPETFTSVGRRLYLSDSAVAWRVRSLKEMFLMQVEASQLEIEDPLDMPVEYLGLSDRTLKALSNLRVRSIKYLGDIVQCTAEELLSADGFGPKCLEAVEQMVERRGLQLRTPQLEIEDPLDTPVEYLGLSTGTLKALLNLRVISIKYLGDIVQCTAKELLNARGFVEGCLEEVEQMLERRGYRLGTKLNWAPPDLREELILPLDEFDLLGVNGGEAERKLHIAINVAKEKLMPIDQRESLEKLRGNLGAMERKVHDDLFGAGIRFLGDLLQCTEERLKEIGLNPYAIKLIRDRLRSIGLDLGLNLDWQPPTTS
jgi:hypothetical protein